MASQLPIQVPRARALHMHNLFNSNIAEISISYSTNVRPYDRAKIISSSNAYDIFLNGWPSLEHKEYFYVMLLNQANKVLGISQISSGGVSGTVADPKMIFQTALKANASSVILAHNHPSGNLTPSDADIALTKKLKEAGKFLDIQVLDHIILTVDNYKSFADDGIM